MTDDDELNDGDELNDCAVLSAVRDSVSGLSTPAAPRLEAITARGRARRLRHLGGLSVAGACAALVAGLIASGTPAIAPAAAPKPGPAPHRPAPAVRLAGFSVTAGPGRATTLTLDWGQLIDPNAVRAALAGHDIPALVTAGEFCSTAVQPSPGAPAVAALAPAAKLSPAAGGPRGFPKPQYNAVVISGWKIPPGVELSIGYRQDAQNRQITFALIVTGAPLTCTTLPDQGKH